MEQIFETTDDFQFDKLTLGKPTTISGGFFIRYFINNKAVYIQPPKCCIKQVQTKSKKVYCDLIFKQQDEQFIQWVENLESRSQSVIYENREKWFETPLEMEDIESSFTSPMKSFKSGKSYILRTSFPTGENGIKIYDEDERDIPLETITENMGVMVILEMQGIKCSSSSFQIDIGLKQMMVLKEANLFTKCILKKDTPLSLGKIDAPLEKENPVTPKESVVPVTPKELVVPVTPKESVGTTDELCEIELEIDSMPMEDAVVIKDRREMYYKLYDEARKKARVARDLALSAYLEAKRIKNAYMLDDLSSSSDEDE